MSASFLREGICKVLKFLTKHFDELKSYTHISACTISTRNTFSRNSLVLLAPNNLESLFLKETLPFSFWMCVHVWWWRGWGGVYMHSAQVCVYGARNDIQGHYSVTAHLGFWYKGFSLTWSSQIRLGQLSNESVASAHLFLPTAWLPSMPVHCMVTGMEFGPETLDRLSRLHLPGV